MATLTKKQIDTYRRDPLAFLQSLVIECAKGVVRWGDVMAPFQIRDFKAIAPSLVARETGKPVPQNRFWIERSKGGSKDTDLCGCWLHLGLFSTTPHEVEIGAGDREQAQGAIKIFRMFVRCNPFLSAGKEPLLEIQNNVVLFRNSGVRITVLSADAATAHGSRPSGGVWINELSHVTRQEFVETMVDNVLKVPGALIVVCTNAGTLGSWQHRWREVSRESGQWYFSTLQEPAPWIKKTDIELRRLEISPNRVRRLWWGEWTPSSSTAIEDEDLKRAVREAGPMSGGEPGYVFHGAADLAVSRDTASTVVVGTRGNHLRLAIVRAWRPGGFGKKIDLEGVKGWIMQAQAQYGCRSWYFDPYQAELMMAQLSESGVPTLGVPFTTTMLKELAGSLMERFADGTISLYEDFELLSDIGRLKFLDKGETWRIDAKRDASGHADRAIALALACLASRRDPAPAWDGTLGDPDLLYECRSMLAKAPKNTFLTDPDLAGWKGEPRRPWGQQPRHDDQKPRDESQLPWELREW